MSVSSVVRERLQAEWDAIVADELSGQEEMARWLAVEQMFSTDGWMHLRGWLLRTLEHLTTKVFTESDEARLRMAQGEGKALRDLLNLPDQVRRLKAEAERRVEESKEKRLRFAEEA